MLGLGHDVVDVAAFAAQLAEPGSRMRGLFSARELRQAAARAQAKHDGEAVHLAAKWAGKESVLKAWCEALGERPYPFTLDDLPWREIEILDDSRGVPHVVLSGTVTSAFLTSLPADDTHHQSAAHWHISLSHDGPVASAVTILD
ncbi:MULTISPECIES: holo-ACP synthase [Bifidobacterium]|uniref:holo-ACP synthase n=1 Tax=Bifidobacterium TaxID=1678 RepID=UPI001BDC30C5|nr:MULTISPECIES: holo-ACP synthase [Bifidobacterium]MBT1160582.1 holo-ACP synthase [Bifidobacterium sp. SO1]MBW3078536.1 holo-ACP synthase [Bifidobacterium simiiventris]